MKILDCEQRSPEWYEAKLGVPSASNFDKIITSKGLPSKSSTKYLHKLAGEHVSRLTEENFQSNAMLRGIELEVEARKLYQIISGEEVKEVGFCLAEGYGASPDGLVGDRGLIEIKCPIAATHIGYLLAKTAPIEYLQQIQGQLLVTGREWCDFMSYYPGIKPLIVRVKRNEVFLFALEVELKEFAKEFKKVVKEIS